MRGPLFLGLCLWAVPLSADQAAVVRLTPRLAPVGPVRDLPVQLAITIDTNQPLLDAKLEIKVPPGFNVAEPAPGTPPTANAVTVSLGSVTGSVTKDFTLSPVPGALQKAEYSAELTLIYTDGAVRRTISQLYGINAAPTISTGMFVLLGLAGVTLGYGVRLLITILKSITPPPAPAPERDAPAPGPITKWVTEHFYFVDYTVTLAMGFLALIALIQNGYPPDNGNAWYNSLGTGVSLGVLANSDLFTRLRK